MSTNPGKLYLVATPIGNLADITLRALQILKEVDHILCEDTRVTGALLKHYEINPKNSEGKSRLLSFHSHSKLQKVSMIIQLLKEGHNLALVSDAGTPGISDPGVILVQEINNYFNDPTILVSVPGPSALISGVTLSGFPTHTFTWLGYVPHKKGRETFFQSLTTISHTVVFYESVHRIVKTLESLKETTPDRPIFIAREITKYFEENIKGSAAELLDFFNQHPDKLKGEFVVVVGPGN